MCMYTYTLLIFDVRLTFLIRYELQTSEDARRLGLGKALINSMKSIGRTYKMSILLLTLIKGLFINLG